MASVQALKLTLVRSLPCVAVTLVHAGQALPLDHVLVDSGSASTVFPVDALERIGVQPDPLGQIRLLRGVGGVEVVILQTVDRMMVGPLELSAFDIDLGAMDYDIDIHGILGVDFLTRARAILDFDAGELRFVAGTKV